MKFNQWNDSYLFIGDISEEVSSLSSKRFSSVTWLMKAEKFITKDMHVWPKKIIQVYNKVRRNYCKLRQLSLITKCDRFYCIIKYLPMDTSRTPQNFCNLTQSEHRKICLSWLGSIEEGEIKPINGLKGGSVISVF